MNWLLHNKILIFGIFIPLAILSAKPKEKPTLKLKTVESHLDFDGKLTEEFWQHAATIKALTMVEPVVNGDILNKTIVKVFADEENLYFGIKCYDNPENIRAFSKSRDAELDEEDNIKIVLDTFLDHRNGYIFAINPLGARYDAVIANRGTRENSNWDCVWDAKTIIVSDGWQAEIIIPVKSLSFKKDLKIWGLNIERKIQRNLERDRWSGIKQDFKVTSLSQAGLLTNLPNFKLGAGLLVALSPNAGFHKSGEQNTAIDKDFSIDYTQRITPDIDATLTLNTDFAETEVDERRTNLTRFPQFFPEKRNFFLRGADIYDFGLGLGKDVIPFFSRKIGLYEGSEIPIIFGTKLNGKLDHTNFGAMFVRTDKKDTLVSPENIGVIRLKQNIFKQSNMGIIATAGDPSGLANSWLLGADFTYQVSDLFGDKNFLAGIWGLFNNRQDLNGDKKSYGIKIEYPNDLFDISLNYKYIGGSFEPSLGFVPRKQIKSYRFGFDYLPRPNIPFIRQFFFESSTKLVTDLENNWESYSIFTAPVHFLLESGDRFEFNIRPTGENLIEPFEIEDGIFIPKGEYNYLRYRLELETASKRPISGEATYWFGTFYNGTLDQIELSMKLRFSTNYILELNYEDNNGKLKMGNFHQKLFGGRIRLNFSPNLQFSSFIQFDNESNQVGANTRLRWTITPLIELYVVYDHNIQKTPENRWGFNSNKFAVKLNYGLWY